MSASRLDARFQEIESELGMRLGPRAVVSGGDIGQAFAARTAKGQRVFIKIYESVDDAQGDARSESHAMRHGDGNATSPTLEAIGLAEARGLRWLGEARAFRIPAVLAAGNDWLVLEWIEADDGSIRRAREARAMESDESLGRQLAALHRSGAKTFGFVTDNWIGRLTQRNSPHEDWASFYAHERIMPLLERAAGHGQLESHEQARLERLVDLLPSLVGPPETPARLHGDLWSGNLVFDSDGEWWLIDPAVYGGHREIDLAMMRLFGGFPSRVFDAYEESFPLSPGADERVPLYQIHPLLVHLCLFGRSYASRLMEAAESALHPARPGR